MFLGVSVASNKVRGAYKHHRIVLKEKIIKMQLGLSYGKTDIHFIVLIPRHGL